MSGNKEAFKMVGQLVNANIDHPFFDEENLCSGLGSELFLAMSTVNPCRYSYTFTEGAWIQGYRLAERTGLW